MFNRRKRSSAEPADPRSDVEGSPLDGEGDATYDDAPVEEDPRARGPWDSAERPVDPEDRDRVGLGGLSVPVGEQMELRLQVDEASGQVQAAMLVAADGAMELRAYAAARHEDLWEEVRPRMLEETTQRGGRADVVEGPFGPALQLLMPAATPDGQQVLQPATVLGIAGPRWLLRVMLFGRPATAFDDAGVLEAALREVVVFRGSQPMAPGDPLPLAVPAGARRVERPR
jgi:hypothetical protein